MDVRVVPMLILMAIAGCASPPAEPVQEAPVPWGGALEHVVLEGSVQWNDPREDPTLAYELVTQAVVHPCARDDGVYFNNVELGTGHVRNGTDQLAVVLDWDAASYTRDHLRVAYRMPGDESYRESTPVASGEALQIDEPIMGTWSFWACPDVETGDSGTPPMFSGELRFEAIAYRASSNAF